MDIKDLYTLDETNLVVHLNEGVGLDALVEAHTGTIMLIPDERAPGGVAYLYALHNNIAGEDKEKIEEAMNKHAQIARASAAMSAIQSRMSAMDPEMKAEIEAAFKDILAAESATTDESEASKH